MNGSSKERLRSLARKRNLAREKLYQVMIENEHEWLLVRKLETSYEKLFVHLWDKYQMDSKFVEKKFFECCEKLVEFIVEEQRAHIEFKKIYKPYQDKFQKLDKEYRLLKLQNSEGGEKK